MNPVPEERSDIWEKIFLFGEANGFRHAEQLGRSLLPIAEQLSSGQVIAILGTVALNNQIWDAIKIPAILENLFAKTMDHLAYTGKAWGRLIRFVYSQGQRESYAALGKKVDAYLQSQEAEA